MNICEYIAHDEVGDQMAFTIECETAFTFYITLKRQYMNTT